VFYFEDATMNLIELIFFIINVICGYLVGRYFWNNFGWIYSPIGFLLGFITPLTIVFLLAFIYSLWLKIFPKTKK